MGSVNLRSSDSLIHGSAVMQRFEENLAMASGDVECPSYRISEGFIRPRPDPTFLQSSRTAVMALSSYANQFTTSPEWRLTWSLTLTRALAI